MSDGERLEKLIEDVAAVLDGVRENLGWSSELEQALRRALDESRSRK